MQGLAADVPEVGIVEKVPGKGMADIFHMDTDLVGASCLKTETQERQIRVFIMDFSLLSPLEFFADPKNGDGRNNQPPAMRVRVDCYTKKLPFRLQ